MSRKRRKPKVIHRAVVVVVGSIALGWGALLSPASAAAGPGDEPCGLLMKLLICRYIPMAPDLEGDIDLTKPQPSSADPAAPAPELLAPAGALPPPDICANGCA